jgi:hypothetical protein
MIRKLSISFILMFCIGVSAFAKGRLQNPYSKWKKLAAEVSSHFKKNEKGTHAKMPTKIPYVVTTLDWNAGSSSYSDSSEKIVMTWNADSTPKQMVIYTYPGKKTVINSFIYKAGGAAFNDLEFLGDWLTAQSTSYTKSAGQWVLGERTTNTYTSQGLTQVLTETWNGSAWENSTLEYYLFDTYDMPLGYLNQSWISGNWVSQSGDKVNYDYGGDNLPDIATFSTWSVAQDDWVPSTDKIKEVYYYNINEEIGAAVVYRMNGTEVEMDSMAEIVWKNYQPAEEDFLAIGGDKFESYTSYHWDDLTTSWIPTYSYAKTYDSEGKETEELTKEWDASSSSWLDFEKATAQYYANGDPKELRVYEWLMSAWSPYFGVRWNNTYDNDGDLADQTYDVSFGTTWDKRTRTIYSYTDPSGFAERKGPEPVKFYPNPATSKVYVELPGSRGENCSVKIMNLNGQVISAAPVNAFSQNIEVDVTGLSRGVYILSVESDKMIRTSRFVKE